MKNATAERKKVNQGRNIEFARRFWNDESITQEELAFRIGLNQKDICKIENQETVDDKILYKIAEALDVPFLFLKDCPLQDSIHKMIDNNSHTLNDNATENVGNDQEINIYDTENALEYVNRIGELSEKLGKAEGERDIYKKLYEEIKSK